MHRILMRLELFLNNNHIEDYEYESINNTLIKNNIYLGKVSRIEPSLRAYMLTLKRKILFFIFQ